MIVKKSGYAFEFKVPGRQISDYLLRNNARMTNAAMRVQGARRGLKLIAWKDQCSVLKGDMCVAWCFNRCITFVHAVDDQSPRACDTFAIKSPIFLSSPCCGNSLLSGRSAQSARLRSSRPRILIASAIFALSAIRRPSRHLPPGCAMRRLAGSIHVRRDIFGECAIVSSATDD